MIDEFMTLGQVQSLVRAKVGRDVSRATLYRWRQYLGFMEPPYIQFHVEALACLGRLIGVGVSPDRAVQMTAERMENK